MQFSQILQKLMDERGWSAYRLAKQLDCSQSTVGHWLANDSKPQRATMRRLEDVFDLKHGYFEEMQKNKPIVDDEFAESLEILRECPETRTLLHASKGMTVDQIKLVAQMMRSLRGGENGEAD